MTGAGLNIAVIVSRFTEDLTERLLQGALESAAEHGVPEWGLHVVHVPGAFELPMAAQELASSGRYDAIVCVGCVIRGETAHFDFVAGESARGIAEVARSNNLPVTLGVVTAENRAQAEARAGGAKTNMGTDAMRAAIEMANLFRELRGDADRGAEAGTPHAGGTH
ncbi:MAG: 6,7-dimethyl-8-ribityllumazine synthase [Chloroflexi bacterium]|nr:6,7-dimethyl-8-ribityllumazine synthase [Chloroflexota bacterium]MDA1148309.1 6,7-dimethyl-8-ribityllumazine synthase [Chloroflexota bacterium]